ncbi:MAG: hypothetical protein DCC67_19905 [Planctomycetota bacterium]|nr:MAG: hypothetical protein DCC67_19905 [Planctomycetota bacterium]
MMARTFPSLALLVVVLAVGPAAPPASAVPMQHQDLHTHTVPSGFFVLGGSWTVDSRMDVLSPEAHPIPLGGTVDFHFREFYNLSASSFTPLIVPGRPNLAPTKPGDDLDAKTWTFEIKNDGCCGFDYSTPWAFEIDPNTGSDKTPEFSLGLSLGPVSFDVKWGGGSVPPTRFLFTPLPNVLRIEFATSDLGQGFFRNGGSLSAKGKLKALRPGAGRVFAENDHYATGEGVLVDDYTWALPDAAGASAIVATSVFDRYRCIPEPAAVGLAGGGWLALAAAARPRRPSRRRPPGEAPAAQSLRRLVEPRLQIAA